MNATITLGQSTAAVSIHPLTGIVQLATDGEHTISHSPDSEVTTLGVLPTITIESEAS